MEGIRGKWSSRDAKRTVYKGLFKSNEWRASVKGILCIP